MISYELAKKLKEAGWKYSRRLHAMILLNNSIRTIGMTEEECKGGILLPDLSELIEACGEVLLEVHPEFSFAWPNGRGEISEKTRHTGSTPEEAVANLWLKLQQDKVDIKLKDAPPAR